MKFQISQNGNTVTARITGQMTFEDRGQAPTLAAALTEPSSTAIVLDLSGVDYMDSAGLGILLTLREKAQAKGNAISLKGMTGDVKEILELACFDTLFRFEA